MPSERKELIAARVRKDAPYGIYEYVLEVMKEGHLFRDPTDQDVESPQIVIETGG